VPVARFCRADAVNVWADAFATRSRDKDFMAYLAALADLEDHGDQNAPGAESDNGGNRPGLLDVPSGRFNRSQDAGRSNVAQWTRSDGSGAVPIVKAMGVDTGVYQCVLCRGYVDCFRSGDSSGRERAVHESEHAAQLQLAYSGWWGPPQAGVGWKFEVVADEDETDAVIESKLQLAAVGEWRRAQRPAPAYPGLTPMYGCRVRGCCARGGPGTVTNAKSHNILKHEMCKRDCAAVLRRPK
jgi:hypothetical protein